MIIELIRIKCEKIVTFSGLDCVYVVARVDLGAEVFNRPVG